VRRIGAWTLAVPVILMGTEAAHALAYRLVYPEAQVRWRVLAATGHGYLAWAPLLLGLACALVAASLLSEVVGAARRSATKGVQPWAFALLPPVSFTLQEFLERWFAVHHAPWWMFEQPTFRVGLLLQLPFAVLAYLTARVLLRAARTAGDALAWTLAPRALALAPTTLPRPNAATPRRLRALALGWGVRGPPVSV
jgi:hypothetical protein